MKIYILNGSIGVGKSTIGALMSQTVTYSSWIEADSFLYMNPFNLCFEDYSFIANKIYELIQYHERKGIKYSFISWCIWDKKIKDLLDKLFADETICYITLTAPDKVVKERVINDINNKKRPKDNIEKVGNKVYTNDSITIENINVEDTIKNFLNILQS